MTITGEQRPRQGAGRGDMGDSCRTETETAGLAKCRPGRAAPRVRGGRELKRRTRSRKAGRAPPALQTVPGDAAPDAPALAAGTAASTALSLVVAKPSSDQMCGGAEQRIALCRPGAVDASESVVNDRVGLSTPAASGHWTERTGRARPGRRPAVRCRPNEVRTRGRQRRRRTESCAEGHDWCM